MLAVLIAGVFFAFTAAFGIAAVTWMRHDRRKQALTALRDEQSSEKKAPAALLRPESSQAWQAWFSIEPLRAAIEAQLQQANLNWTPGKFLVLTTVLAGIAAAGVLMLRTQPGVIPAILLACLGGSVPYLYVRSARAKRTRKIEEQFPDALDFLARAMRAGHAFSVSLEMLADETPEPMGGEFRKLYQQQNLGSPIEVALQAFAKRCGLLDVEFFVSAVLLQKETGGNLTEILSRLSFTIRERLRLKGQVRAASAHGRVTGLVLTVMPILLMLGLMAISPGYLKGMMSDPDGRYLIGGAIAGQFMGYLCIRSITDIRV